MTREEARKELSIIAVEFTGKLGATTDEQEGYALSRQVDAIDMALDALWPISREQVKKVFGGEWKEYEAFPMAPSLNGYPCSRCGTHISPSSVAWMNFCPRCGAPMSDKAVDMVMERLEALKDETD